MFLKYAKGIAVRDATLMPYLIAAGIYLVLTYIITKAFEGIERKVNYEE